MKKIVLILLFMISPMVVLADAMGPKLLGDYEAIVINKEGVKTSNGSIIPYNTKIYVISVENSYYYTVCKIDNSECYFLTSLDGIVVSKEEVVPDDLKKSHYEKSEIYTGIKKLLIVDANGKKMMKGPAEVYGNYDITNIDDGTFMTSNFCFNSYCYIDINDYKGWIETDNGVAIYDDSTYLAFDNLTFYDEKNNYITIQSGDILKGYYMGDALYYLTYNNEKSILNLRNNPYYYKNTKIGVKSKYGYLLTIKDTDVMLNGNIQIKIPKGEKVKILYGAEETFGWKVPSNRATKCIKTSENAPCFYYVEYNEKSGFINDTDVLSLNYYEEKNEIRYPSRQELLVFNKELMIYDTNNLFQNCMSSYGARYSESSCWEFMHETGKTVPSNTTVTSYSSTSNYLEKEEPYKDVTMTTYFYYTLKLIKYGDTIGWVISDEETETGKKDYIASSVIVYENENNDNLNTIQSNDENNVNIKIIRNNSSNTLIYTLLATVIVCIVTIIIIIINNSRHNLYEKHDKNEG